MGIMRVAALLSLCLVLVLCFSDAHDHHGSHHGSGQSKGKRGGGAKPHLLACKGKAQGDKCSFVCKSGTKTATCTMTTQKQLACGTPPGHDKTSSQKLLESKVIAQG